YTRGNDLSSGLQGAGGIGGLLARTDNTKLLSGDPLATSYYHCDGNGNVTCLMSPYQQIAAKYLYDPFGNTLAMYGALAAANTYRFSSKEWIGNSGLYYYLYRFYDPNLQRWVNRDPIGELGGMNLYQFIRNDAVANRDAYGLLLNSPCQAAKDRLEKAIEEAGEEAVDTGRVSSQTSREISDARNAVAANCPDKPSPPPKACPSPGPIPAPQPPPWILPTRPPPAWKWWPIIILIPWPGNPIWAGA
ncbi:MAG: RHS repeat-associated core domain-containing protein, partial [Anaerolineaceae bacterium]|nr:RHS repeat-associated core domain-containing protein [Formivibrio sp.]MDR3575039.1 RHS repeat-associated core domain-containing protein [Anaerolineaceae bacterium]